MDRRTFLRFGSAGAAVALAGAGVGAFAQEPAEKAVEPVYRTLGRTGLKISVISLGSMRTSEPAVMQAAFDRGVNYVDTARVYLEGKNEGQVGEAIKGRRDKVYVATKVATFATGDALMKSVETSLASLKTDYVDVLQLHKPPAKDVLNPEAKAALAELKKQGKVRFTGVTTHADQVAVIDAVLSDPDKFFDMVLVKYNFQSPPNVKDAIARAAKANLGVIAMKTQEGGYKTKELGDIAPHQAALKWVLQDTNVHAAVPSMVDVQQVEEDIAVMGMMKLTRADERLLERYAEAIKPYHCRGCGECAGTCPYGVDMCTVNRCLMYAEGYEDLKLARTAYSEVPGAVSLAACGDCATCEAKCAHGLDLGERMRTARTLFV